VPVTEIHESVVAKETVAALLFVTMEETMYELHGAVSWGSRDCSRNHNEYTVFANIYNLKSWITRYSGVY